MLDRVTGEGGPVWSSRPCCCLPCESDLGPAGGAISSQIGFRSLLLNLRSRHNYSEAEAGLDSHLPRSQQTIKNDPKAGMDRALSSHPSDPQILDFKARNRVTHIITPAKRNTQLMTLGRTTNPPTPTTPSLISAILYVEPLFLRKKNNSFGGFRAVISNQSSAILKDKYTFSNDNVLFDWIFFAFSFFSFFSLIWSNACLVLMFDSEKYNPSCTANFETIRGDYPVCEKKEERK